MAAAAAGGQGPLVAPRAVAAGEDVLEERVLLHVPHLKPSNPLYKPLQAYFEQHGLPPSVVLKYMACVLASPSTQAAILRCYCPDPAAFADAPVVREARRFAARLLAHPPAPEFAEWAACQLDDAAGGGEGAGAAASSAATSAAGASGGAAEGAAAAASMQQQLPQEEQEAGPEEGSEAAAEKANPAAFSKLVQMWLIWVLHGHKHKLGTALLSIGSRLPHTCDAPSTAYRSADGHIRGVLEPTDGSGDGGDDRQLPPAPPPPTTQPGGAAALAPAAAAAAGAHVAVVPLEQGQALSTCYLGLGHRRLLSTPARKKMLADKFLVDCRCPRCTEAVDMARGIPCPSCSGAFRSADRLLQAEVVLSAWALGQPLAPTGSSGSTDGNAAAPAEAAAAGAAGGSEGAASEAGSSTAGASGACGYIYARPGPGGLWTCDTCHAEFQDDTAELWGRHTKSHATVEANMQDYVTRLDTSMDTAPFVREPALLHARVVDVLRLLGPRHWVSWRLLLLALELQCGAMEEAMLRTQVQRSLDKRHQAAAAQAAGASGGAAAGAAAAAAASGRGASPAAQPADTQQARSGGDDAPAPDDAAAAAVLQPATWALQYCKQLWASVHAAYGIIEAGQTLGFHFTEAAQVLLQVASSPGILPQHIAEQLIDAALQLNQLVLPGVCSVLGPTYNPLAQLLGAAGCSGVGAGPGAAAAVATQVQRQMQQRAAEAAKMRSLVDELRRLEVEAGGQAAGGKGGGREQGGGGRGGGGR